MIRSIMEVCVIALLATVGCNVGTMLSQNGRDGRGKAMTPAGLVGAI